VSGANWGVGAETLRRASRVMPGGVFGFHKLFASDRFPSFADRGEGPYLYDVDGTRYVDHVLGKGPIVLGHAHPEVDHAVIRQIGRGNLLSLSPADMVEVAEQVLARFPGAELLRFHKTGSDACGAAARLARVFTGRAWVLSAGYHGWHDWCLPDTPGVPAGVPLADFGYDLDRLRGLLERHAGDVAAVFVEPQPSLLDASFYREARSLAGEFGALLVLDEVKTGFRLGAGEAHRDPAVRPDLTVVSKALANGYCLSALLGREAVLRASERTHISSTYDIEAAPFAAALATLHALEAKDVAGHLARTGGALVDGLNATFARHGVPARAFGPGAMFRVGFSDTDYETYFYEAMMGRGVLLYPYDNHFVSAAHGPEQVRAVLDAADVVLGTRPPAADGPAHVDVAGWEIHRFQNRKGFLRGAPGASGRAAHDSARAHARSAA
jgi:glutamate-1-semialdehyde 2,1-aminomutase